MKKETFIDNGIEFRKLDNKETKEFKKWARENYTPHYPINSVWHPLVRAECELINQEKIKK